MAARAAAVLWMIATAALSNLLRASLAIELSRPDAPSWGAVRATGEATTSGELFSEPRCGMWVLGRRTLAVWHASAICSRLAGRTMSKTLRYWRCIVCYRLGLASSEQRCGGDRPRGSCDGARKSYRNSRISSSQERSSAGSGGKGGSSDISWPSRSRYMIAAL